MSSQARAPRGIPSGGQFAATQHPASACVALLARTDDMAEDVPADSADYQMNHRAPVGAMTTAGRWMI